MIKVNRIVHFNGCAVSSMSHSKFEPIQNGQDEMNERKAANFSNELGTIILKSSWKAG